VGGAGDPPAPPGDPPGGMAVTCGCDKTAPFRSMPLPIPSGGSPDGTGESPVLPTLNTYSPISTIGILAWLVFIFLFAFSNSKPFVQRSCQGFANCVTRSWPAPDEV